jgi:anti-sigma B factor antagonist
LPRVSRTPWSAGGVDPLSITVDSSEGVVAVVVGGEIDAHTSLQLRSCLLDQVARGGADTVVIDLTSVSFCDSTALGVLVGTHRRMQGEDRRLEIRAPSPAVRHLLEVSGLDQVLNLC